MSIYADATFLVSLCIPDANSAAAVRFMSASGGDRFVTTLGELEVVNAIRLRVFRKEVSSAPAQSSLSDLRRILRGGVFQLREMT